MSLFNPWWWLLGIGILGATFTGGAWMGYDYADTKWQVKWLDHMAKSAAAIAKAEHEARSAEQEATQQKEKDRVRYENLKLASDSSLADALDELRNRAKLRPRQPAASAPAVSRDYEAAASDLSLQDQEFLIREADRADRVALQLGAAQREIITLRKAFGLETEEIK